MEFRSKRVNRKTGGRSGPKTSTPRLQNSTTPNSLPPGFQVCDPAYSLCPDCARALREETCPKMKESLKKKAR